MIDGPASDYLRIRDCAVILGVTRGYIVGEIREGRLAALVRRTPLGRVRYRVVKEDWLAYMAQHWPRKIAS